MRAAASRRALRQCTRQLSSLATVTEKGAATAVNLKADGLADLPITLPIHKRGETAMEPRPGATMIEVIVDGNPVQIESGSSILQACESVGINVPRFCFHERLSVAGNCRMCLVEIEKSPKPVASCAYPTMPGMKIFTNSSMVKKAREGVMEFMLANHPLDCPICDQGGECDLQDQAMMFGSDRSRYAETKRGTMDKNLGPLVKTVMTRCIHCTRCVRFSQEVAGVNMLGTVGRGNAMEIGTYVGQALNSEMSGNVVDLCPVGALTSKPNAFTSRSWEYRSTASVDVLDGCCPSIKVDTAKGEVMRVQPRLNEAINEEWISDKTRYAVDGLKRQRLDVPLLKKDGKLVPVSWREALSAAAEKIGAAAPSELGVIAGPLADLEALVCAKDLFNKLGSTATSSTAAAGSADLRAGYTMGSTIAGIEEADAVLLVGTNLRVEAPLVNARVRKMVRHFGLKVGVVGPAADLTFEYDHIGDSAAALSQLKAGEGFGAVLGAAKRPIVLLGAGAVARPDGAAVASAAKKVAKAAGCLAEGWNGYGVLQSAGGAAGALDVGFVPGPTAGPLSALKLVYLLGADEVPFEELQPGAFVVYQGHHGDAGAQAADLVLPGNARDDWQILVALSQLLGKPLPYDTVGGVRERMAAIAPNLADALGVRVEAASPELATLTLEHSDASEPLSAAPLASSITNFYMTDPVPRASETMAKCYQAFGGRV